MLGNAEAGNAAAGGGQALDRHRGLIAAPVYRDSQRSPTKAMQMPDIRTGCPASLLPTPVPDMR